jgi:hypothetical protein
VVVGLPLHRVIDAAGVGRELGRDHLNRASVVRMIPQQSTHLIADRQKSTPQKYTYILNARAASEHMRSRSNIAEQRARASLQARSGLHQRGAFD